MRQSSETFNRNLHFKAVVVAGVICSMLLLVGTAGFLFYQTRLQQRADEIQTLYKDLLDFRSMLTKLQLAEERPEIFRKVIQNTTPVTLHSLNYPELGEQSRLSEIAHWLQSQHSMLEKMLREIEMQKSGAEGIISRKILQLDEVMLQVSLELHHAHEQTSGTIQFFLFIVLLILLLFSGGATTLIIKNYRQTVIPLNRLAGTLLQFNKDLPESIHDTAEDVKKSCPKDCFSSDINRVTETIVTFCQDLEMKNRKLDELFIKDEKTNLYNYRHFKEHLIGDVARAKRYNDLVSLAMLDIDHFKAYNDANGHIAGDRVLQRIAEIILEECRHTDVPARFGGEEFAILFPRTDAAQARGIVVRLMEVICAEPFERERNQPGGRLTISAGIATFPHDAQGWYSLINNADRALYESKSTGRNKVINYEEIRTEGSLS
ncbi:MAG: GGDEF domain-containing protein [Prosthecochloris sp.]|uniref:GGDEF domain-containing protein n=1 Tax=Prosthecochloris sp. TaxID=290513 RepID=UPI002588941E|nr:GGDEF domain-containing protein [Prosthecochloris sp.]MCW8797483.1 GGDEF domain-containing protein [Prosthecochloris sp.]